MLALYAANPGSVPGIPQAPLSLPGVIDSEPQAKAQGGQDCVAQGTASHCASVLVASRMNGACPAGSGAPQTPLFETYSDWDREVKRTGASGWRVCSINEGYMISTW